MYRSLHSLIDPLIRDAKWNGLLSHDISSTIRACFQRCPKVRPRVRPMVIVARRDNNERYKGSVALFTCSDFTHQTHHTLSHLMTTPTHSTPPLTMALNGLAGAGQAKSAILEAKGIYAPHSKAQTQMFGGIFGKSKDKRTTVASPTTRRTEQTGSEQDKGKENQNQNQDQDRQDGEAR